MADRAHDFESAKKRLEEIADAVGDDSLPLDEALDLYEEAVALGLAVSDLVEEGIVVEDEPSAEAQTEPQESPDSSSATASA